jgi:hypothetical protein
MAQTRELNCKTVRDLHFPNCVCSSCATALDLPWPQPLTPRDRTRSRFFSLDPEFRLEFEEWLKRWGERSRMGGCRDPYQITAELERSISTVASARRFSFPQELVNRSAGSPTPHLTAIHAAVDGNLLTLFRAYVNDTCSQLPGRGLLFTGAKVGVPEVLELLRMDDQVFEQIKGELSKNEWSLRSPCHVSCQSLTVSPSILDF